MILARTGDSLIFIFKLTINYFIRELFWSLKDLKWITKNVALFHTDEWKGAQIKNIPVSNFSLHSYIDFSETKRRKQNKIKQNLEDSQLTVKKNL